MAHSSVASEPPQSSEPERPPSRLVLASEALREDLAPKHPGAKAGRMAIFGAGVALALLGVAIHAGIPPLGHSWTTALAAGGAACAIGLLPISYRRRAIASASLGALLLLLGVLGEGPGAALASAPGADTLTRALSLGLLPAALLFRAHYRAYRRARAVLAVCLVGALPFALGRIGVVLDGGAPFLARTSAVLDLAAVLSGLFGFMGEDTTAGGSVWAAIVLIVLPADLALIQLDRVHHHTHGSAAFTHGLLVHGAGTVGLSASAVLVAVGAYQTLSALFGADARRCARAQATEDAKRPGIEGKGPPGARGPGSTDRPSAPSPA